MIAMLRQDIILAKQGDYRPGVVVSQELGSFAMGEYVAFRFHLSKQWRIYILHVRRDLYTVRATSGNAVR